LRGYSKFQLSDYTGSIADFTKAVENDKFLTDAMYYRAIANIELNNYKAGLKDLISAIDIDDRHDYYFVTRGYLHAEFGDTLGAVKDYLDAIKLNPENEGAPLNLGLIYLQKKEYDKSFEYAEKAIKINPNNLQAVLLKGNIHQYKQEYREAINEYKKVVERDSNNVRTQFFLAICYQEMEKFDSAYYYYKNTLALNPDNSVCYYHRALLNLETENYANALLDLNKVINLNPKNIYSYHLRGVVKLYLEDYAGAEKDFSKAIELYPNLIDAYQNRAYARGLQNKIQGYYQDKDVVDSLFKMGELAFEDTDLDYFKSITDFRADFTNVSEVSENKIQYIEQSIRMISIYHPVLLKADKNPQETIKLSNYISFDEIDIPLELINYDYSDLNSFQVAELKDKIDNSIVSYPDSAKYEVLKAMVLGWQMEYDFANSVLDSLKLNYPLNLIAAFLKGNHSFLIGNIMASLDVKHFSLDKSDQISFSEKGSEVADEKYENAIENYNQAIAINPDFIYSYYNRAYVNALLKNYGDAINDFSRCINSDDSFADALYNRGLLYIYINKYTEGCQDLSKAGEMGINNAYRVIYKYCKN
jgi:tetratricopeptide (TPR) repeat protein